MLIDFHSHTKPAKDSPFLSVFNHDISEPLPEVPEPHFYCSGIHPWSIQESDNIDKEIEQKIAILKESTKNPRFLCLGEMGLDRLRGVNLALQIKYLKAQLALAIEIDAPAVIIHCVRAFDQFMKVIKESKYEGFFVFHDYGANQDISQALLKNPKVYFSLGAALTRANQKQTVKKLPLDRVFLETDDRDCSIQSVYRELSELHGRTSQELEAIIQDNFYQLFKSRILTI